MKNLLLKSLGLFALTLLHISDGSAANLNIRLFLYGNMAIGNDGVLKAIDPAIAKTKILPKISNGVLSIPASAMNSILTDPIGGVVKGSIILYDTGDDSLKINISNENQAIKIPNPNDVEVCKISDITQNAGAFRLIRAFYGDLRNMNTLPTNNMRAVDVTAQIQYMKDNVSTTPGVSTTVAYPPSAYKIYGDCAPNIVKSMLFIFNNKGNLGVALIKASEFNNALPQYIGESSLIGGGTVGSDTGSQPIRYNISLK